MTKARVKEISVVHADKGTGSIELTDKPYLTREDFPDVGEKRFFVLKHNPKSQSNPVTIELREYLTDTRHPSFSRLLLVSSTIADKERIVETAGEMVVRVGKIDDVVGVY